MIAMDALKEMFTEKIAKTGSLDAALLKVCWVAYNKGLEEGRADQTIPEGWTLVPVEPTNEMLSSLHGMYLRGESLESGYRAMLSIPKVA